MFRFAHAVVLGALLCAIASHAQLTPAVAANMKFAMAEICSVFTRQSGISVKPVYGSSGKLVTQIRNGAPFDLFVSADISYADSVAAWHLAVDTPKVYAFGKLVLWSAKPGIIPDSSLAVLTSAAVKTVAIGDLKTTVYGPAAQALLGRLGLWERVLPKLVYGENITQVAQYIATGAADIGFVAKSLVLANELRGKGVWVAIDSTLYPPLPQAAVKLRYGAENNPLAMQRFYDFLYSPGSRAILTSYGYSLP